MLSVTASSAQTTAYPKQILESLSKSSAQAKTNEEMNEQATAQASEVESSESASSGQMINLFA